MELHFDFANEDYESYLSFVRKEKISLSCPVVHIAGSNGKSSVAQLLFSLYLASGYKVGLFLNTYYSSAEEMILINGKPVETARVEAKMKEYAKPFDKFGLSDFQKIFVIACCLFGEEKLDLAIIETGMGGAMDATNIPYKDKALSIITNISLEHTEILGTTLSQIAYEKAGILVEGVPVLFGELDESCKETLIDASLTSSCPIHNADQAHNIAFDGSGFHFIYGGREDLYLPRLSQFDVKNASVALEAVSLLKERFPFKEETINQALAIKPLRGHMEAHGDILFDGAENAYAMNGLALTLPAFAAGKKVHVIFASKRGQNIAVELPLIDNHTDGITLTTFEGEDVRNEDDYFLYAPDYEYIPSFKEALASLNERFPEDKILVTGCLEFVYACLKEVA